MRFHGDLKAVGVDRSGPKRGIFVGAFGFVKKKTQETGKEKEGELKGRRTTMGRGRLEKQHTEKKVRYLSFATRATEG